MGGVGGVGGFFSIGVKSLLSLMKSLMGVVFVGIGSIVMGVGGFWKEMVIVRVESGIRGLWKGVGIVMYVFFIFVL